MRCSRVRKLLTEYADEALTIGLEEQVRLHLESCGECATLAADLRSTVAALQSLPRLETSPDFAQQLRRHLPVAVALSRRQPARAGLLGWFRQWRPRGARRFGLVLAPLALGVSLGLYFFGQGAGVSQHPVAGTDPVISESAYLAAVAREHASYASEHPLIDTSAANLKAVATATGP